MNGTQTLIAIIMTAAIVCGGWSFKAWLAYQSREKEMAAEAKAQEQETERLRIIADMSKRIAQAAAKAASEEK